MTDWLPKETRSKIMSSIRSKRTKPEMKVHNYLKSRKIKHRMYPNLPGKPDILIKGSRKLVFVDGCFWHKCPLCYKEPTSNTDYWLPKIERNVKRDSETTKHLEINGWEVIRIWEHEVKNDIAGVLERITSGS